MMTRRTKETIQGIIGVLLFVIIWMGCGYIECHYTRKDCVVTDTSGSVVCVVDKGGHEWCYEIEGEGPSVGDVVDIHMFTNHTDGYIYDDEIVGVSTH